MSRRSTPGPDTPEGGRGFDSFELRLGDVMRGERATLGKSLIDVQRELKIKATYIAAIENAEPSAFDTPGFIAGYVRSYARYLQLDPEWAWEQFCLEAGFQNPHGLSAAASAPKPQRKTGLDALGDPNAAFVPMRESAFAQIEMRAIGSVLVRVALIGAVGYGGYSVLQEVQRVQLAPVDTAPGVVAELDTASITAPTASAVPADTMAGNVAPEGLDRIYRPRELDVPVVDFRDGPIASVTPGSVGALAGQQREEFAPEPTDIAEAEPVDETPDNGPQVFAEGPKGLHLIATRPAWVQVSSADGTVLFEKILEPGENWEVPATEEPPLLRTGNSGAVYFSVAGQTYGPAAPGAQVVRNVALSADTLTETFALADPGADPDLAVAVALLQAGD